VFWLTRHIITPLIMLSLVLTIALATGGILSYRIAYALGMALVAGFIVALFKLHGLSATVTRVSNRSEVGCGFEQEITVLNNSGMPKRGVEVVPGGDIAGGSTRVVSVPRGAPGRQVLTIRTECSKRGLLRVGPVKLRARDPFGFIKLERKFGQRFDVIVHPATFDLPRFQVPSRETLGNLKSRDLAHFVTTQACSIREYVDGDSLNRVHWPMTARHGRLMVKEFDATRSTRAWLVVDMERRVQAGPGAESTGEMAITTAASIARRLSRTGTPVGLVAYGDTRRFLPPGRGDAHLSRILDELAVAEVAGTAPLDKVLLEEERAMERHDSIIVVTPSTDSRWVRLLSDIGRRHATACVVSIDPCGFGAEADTAPLLGELSRQRVPFCLVRRGQSLSDALSRWSGLTAGNGGRDGASV